MKKAIAIISLLLVSVLLGHLWQNSNKQNENNQTSENGRFSGFEKPEEKADISGIVKTIIGNEITVLKIERQATGENNNIEESESESESDKDIDSKKEQRPTSGMGMGMGMGMGGTRPTTETDSEDIDARLEMLKSMSTGEEKIIIPVGIKMLKNEDGEITEATLNDIVKDRMLLVWTDEDITDKNVANFVIIN